MKLLKRLGVGVLVLAVSAVLLLLAFRPDDQAGEGDAYFSVLNTTLKTQGIERPAIVIDLDRVDRNLAAISAQIQAPLQYRVVDKSLPSLELLRYVMAKTGTRRVMSFHEPYLALLFRELDPATDFLLGKPMPVASARRFYAGLATDARAGGAARVQWLIDTAARLEEYRKLAEELGMTLGINVEIDVGLHRGGVKTREELVRILDVIAAHPDRLRFRGLMGYDGHLTHVPVLLGSKEDAVRDAFDALTASYRNFVAAGKGRYPAMFTEGVTLNGAGSKTYRLYTPAQPLNDLAMGSCVVMPSAFDEFTLAEHVPAMFIAAPVLKKIDGFDVPFLDAVAPAAAWWNPNWRKTFYVYGGAWSEKVVWPQGAEPNSLTTSPPNENLFPNQNMLNGSETLKLDVGDFVFYRPKQGDAMMQFEEILVTRGGKVVDRWKPLPVRL